MYIPPTRHGQAYSSVLACGDVGSGTTALQCLTAHSETRQMSRVRKRRNSLPGRLNTSQQTPSVTSYSLKSPYGLTPRTLEYLTDKSDFIATATSLVAMDTDVLSNLMDSGHFQAQTPVIELPLSDLLPQPRSDEGGRVVAAIDVQTYRKVKLKEHPALENHLSTHILPLAQARYPTEFPGRTGEDVIRLFESPMAEDLGLRMCMISQPSSEEYQDFLRVVVDGLVREGRWQEVVTLLDSAPTAAVQASTDWTLLRDFALCILTAQLPKVGVKAANPLYEVSDPTVRARAALGSLKLWGVSAGIKLLRQCMDHSDGLGQDMEALVLRRFTEMQLYQKVGNKQ